MSQEAKIFVGSSALTAKVLRSAMQIFYIIIIIIYPFCDILHEPVRIRDVFSSSSFMLFVCVFLSVFLYLSMSYAYTKTVRKSYWDVIKSTTSPWSCGSPASGQEVPGYPAVGAWDFGYVSLSQLPRHTQVLKGYLAGSDVIVFV
jgi:hypothetical protein